MRIDIFSEDGHKDFRNQINEKKIIGYFVGLILVLAGVNL